MLIRELQTSYTNTSATLLPKAVQELLTGNEPLGNSNVGVDLATLKSSPVIGNLNIVEFLDEINLRSDMLLTPELFSALKSAGAKARHAKDSEM